MAFCTNCGATVAEGARFCVGCGQPLGEAAAAGPPPPPPPPPIEKLAYTVTGSNLQIARVHLKHGQEVYAEAGKMVYKTSNVEWETRMTGGTFGEKFLGALRRSILGESLFLTYFRASGDGEVGFAGHYPGKVQVFELAYGQSILAQRDAFLFAQPSVQLNIALVKRFGAGFFGGEGFILEKLTGPGTVFIHAGGDFVEFNLMQGQRIQIETGCIVAFDETVEYDIQMAGGIKTAIFGGEGLFLATLTGPGRVIVQSMTLQRLRQELAPAHRGGDQHTGVHVFDIFGSDD